MHYLNRLFIQKVLKILICCLIMNVLSSSAVFTRAAQQSFHVLGDWLLRLIVFHFLYYFNLLPIFIYTGCQLHSLVSQNDLFIGILTIIDMLACCSCFVVLTIRECDIATMSVICFAFTPGRPGYKLVMGGLKMVDCF